MPTLRSRSVGTSSSKSRSPAVASAASAAASTSTPAGVLGNGSGTDCPSEAASVVTAPGVDPVTPGGDREHGPSSSLSALLSRPQTRAAVAASGGAASGAATGGTARKTRQRLGKKVLLADQRQERQHEEGAAAPEFTVTRRTSKRVQERGGGRGASGLETKETSAAVVATTTRRAAAAAESVLLEMADRVAVANKGKRKAVVNISDSDEGNETAARPSDVDTTDAEEEANRRNGSSSCDGLSSHAALGGQLSPRASSRNARVEATKAKFLAVARRRAAHFAHYVDEEDGPGSSSAVEVAWRVLEDQKRRLSEHVVQAAFDDGRAPYHGGEQDGSWPGPFVIARQLVEGRQSAAAARHEATRGAEPDPQQSLVKWTPSRRPDFRKIRIPTSLHDMCVEVLSANIEHVTSLVGVPDADKKLICEKLCAHRIMTPSALSLYLLSEPAEVIVPDCTFATEETLTESLAKCSTERLEVLELGLCGRAVSDQLCASTLAGLSCSLPALHTLILNGAYRLTDVGLKTLVNGTPKLSTLNLKQCNMISAAGIEAVADSVGTTLKTLSLECCTQLDTLKILPPILKMSNLESLSLSGLSGMSDGIISELAVILGLRLRELYITDCKALTDAAVKAISMCCSGLQLLEMGHLPKLTDGAIGSLADGCRSLRILQLGRGKFSDNALAALITASGSSLTELSLNSVRQVGDLTLSALSKHSKSTLERLDLSFCRAVSDGALGLLADTCEGLRELRLFGCTQVTEFFVKGHSNALLKVIGLPKTVLEV